MSVKVITKKRTNKLTQNTVTEVYIEIDGETEFFGQASEPKKVFALIGEANDFVREKSKEAEPMKMDETVSEEISLVDQVYELSNMLGDACFVVGDGVTYANMTNEQKAAVKELFFEELKRNNFIVTDEIIKTAESEMMFAMATLLMQYKYYTQGTFQQAKEQLKEGTKATIVKFSEFGFPVIVNTIIEDIAVKPYAQYSESLHIIHKPKRKRNQYVNIILPKDKMLVYDGWHNIDTDNLMYNVRKGNEDVTVKQSKYASFDKQFMQDAISSIKGKLIVKLNVD